MAGTSKLTAPAVSKAKVPAMLFDGGGLYLRISESGAKRWVSRPLLDGKNRDLGHQMGLGSKRLHLAVRIANILQKTDVILR
jgi:hypothetical protein